MSRRLLFASPLLFLLLFSCTQKRPGKPRVLIYSKAAVGVPDRLQQLIQSNDWLADTTADSSRLRGDSLREDSAVVFWNTPGNSLDHYAQADLERYLQAGGGYVGVHAATSSKYEWG